MLKYRFDVWDALERVGFNIYKAKKTGLLSQDAMKKLKNDDTSISLKALNNLCLLFLTPPTSLFLLSHLIVEVKLTAFPK